MKKTIDQAIQTTKKILSLVEISDFKIEPDKNSSADEIGLSIVVSDQDSGILIGYHGETLLALQYLAGQIVNKDRPAWVRLVLNVNEYRAQRESQLKEMAQNAASRAVTTGSEIEMPYLTPAERRIIHLELTDRKDIATYSEGEGKYRRLIVAPKSSSLSKD